MSPTCPTTLSAAGGTPGRSSLLELGLRLAVAVSLSWVFWSVLWQGGGLIGGDLYPYYFPQKTWLKAALDAGTIPLWNPLVGFGYPVLGESQTGALYPPNLLLYKVFDVNTAYVISQLGHYILAFCLTCALGGRLGLSRSAQWLMSTAFVYGWFPPRICLEWAIIGGTWMVASLWAATGYLQTGRRFWLGLLAGSTALNLLAGHFHLEFITLLLLAVWPWVLNSPTTAASSRRRLWGGLGLAICCGFFLAAVQLFPTWELKRLSQRQDDHPAFSPTYGHLPPAALSQLWSPWSWYAGDEPMDRLLERATALAVPDATNQAEAQLYAGLLPLILAGLACLMASFGRTPTARGQAFRWSMVIVVSLIMATGWPTRLLAGLPGLSYFRGPGRYSIAAVMALAVLAGTGFDAIARRRQWSPRFTTMIAGVVMLITIGDLWCAGRQYRFGTAPYVGRQVFYATLVDRPPIKAISASPLRKFFAQADSRMRLYAPGPNMPTMLGVSALPVYLGLGPQIYETDMVRVDFDATDSAEIAASVRKLHELGVTHLLLERRIDAESWQATPLGDPIDPLLNGAFARLEPFHLYELRDAPGRVSFRDDGLRNKVLSVTAGVNSLTIRVQVMTADRLIVRDLAYPGWILSGQGIPGTTTDGLFRTVDLTPQNEPIELVWNYQPQSVRRGAAVSLLGLLLLLILACPGLSRPVRKPDPTKVPNLAK